MFSYFKALSDFNRPLPNDTPIDLWEVMFLPRFLELSCEYQEIVLESIGNSSTISCPLALAYDIAAELAWDDMTKGARIRLARYAITPELYHAFLLWHDYASHEALDAMTNWLKTHQRRGRTMASNQPSYSLCPVCKHRIVEATTADGHTIALDTSLRTYRLILQSANDGTYRAEAERSSGYVVHDCRGGENM